MTAPAAGDPVPWGTGGDPVAARPTRFPRRGRAVLDGVLRVLGGLVGLAGGVLAASLSVLLVPLRVADLPLAGVLGVDGTGPGAWRVPVAVVLAIGGNLLLPWLARRATGSRWGVLLPALGWFAMIVAAARTTTEGDRLMMPDDWIAALTLFSGALVLVVACVVTILGGPGRPAPARTDTKEDGYERDATSTSR